MHGTTDFAAFLSLYRDIHETRFLTATERSEVLDVVAIQFQSRAHDQRLQRIVERLCTEAPSDSDEAAEPAQDEPEGEAEPAAEGPAPRPVVSGPRRGRKGIPKDA